MQRLFRDSHMTGAHAYTDYDVCAQILGRELMADWPERVAAFSAIRAAHRGHPRSHMSRIRPTSLRRALGNFATGVTVVTAATASGRRSA